MSDSWYEDLYSPLLDKLKALEQLDENAVEARKEAEAKLENIKAGTRLKDRNRWLLWWMNGDRSVYNEIKPLRDEVKHRRQQIANIPQSRQAVINELDHVIVNDLEQNDPDYRRTRAEQRELSRKRDACGDALKVTSATRGNITSVLSSLHVTPNGRAAVAAAKSKPGEISAQIKTVHEKVVAVNRVAGSYGSVNGGLVRKLNTTFLGSEFGYEQRKNELDDAVRTLNEVARKVTAIHDKIEKRLQSVERDRARLVKARRDRLLSTHGLKAT